MSNPATPQQQSSPDDPSAPAFGQPTPAQRSMKREAKTPEENGDPVGPNDGPAITERKAPPTAGDAPVGESDNHGSSPYGEPGLPEKPLRDE